VGRRVRVIRTQFPDMIQEDVINYRRHIKEVARRVRSLRSRGTAVVVRDRKVLLVRDRGKFKFSLPGGGVRHRESTVTAVQRELFEELGLIVVDVERRRDCDFLGSANRHKVCDVEVVGEPRLCSRELDRFVWWNFEDEIPLCYHVTFILRMMGLLLGEGDNDVP